MSRHLVVALSSHGFGHIGQTAPVIDALRRLMPGLRVSLHTAAPRYKLIERFGRSVEISVAKTDVGMLQVNAQSIDLAASAAAYSRFHDDWEARVDIEAQALRDLGADAVLANVPYLQLAGASRAGIPSLALCSINWMDIYASFFGSRQDASTTFLRQMRDAYESARAFLQPEPSMPMSGLANRCPIGPVCQGGTIRRKSIADRLGLGMDERLIMVSMGGMELRPPVEQWPKLSGVRLLVPASWRSRHPSTVDFESLDIPYIDALWSSDALICKPGYGSFVEAACAGVPVLYIDRPDWPEVPFLVSWLESAGHCAPLDQECWLRGDFGELLFESSREHPPKVEASGVGQAAEAIAALLA